VDPATAEGEIATSPALIAKKNSKPSAPRVSQRLLPFFTRAEGVVNKAAASVSRLLKVS
jgi:hypothetical protein